MEVFGTIIRFFQQGGLFMYPIVIILAIGLAIAIERFIFLSRSQADNRKLWAKLQPMLQNADYAGALKITSGSTAAVGQVLNYGINRLRSTTDRHEIEMAMEESLLEVMPQLEKRTPYLAVLANIATLLGLLGTIIGLIQAFTAVANVNPAEKADLLSASISVAMNTTAFGLMVAIPLLLLHAVLQARTTELVDSIEMASVKFLNAIRVRPASKAAPSA
ncbi:MotA/TolQ/ExbB proton channel family protein [bacterium]|nr:MotA/TolQ/ExbB proton channel family protein [bacterium]